MIHEAILDFNETIQTTNYKKEKKKAGKENLTFICSREYCFSR